MDELKEAARVRYAGHSHHCGGLCGWLDQASVLAQTLSGTRPACVVQPRAANCYAPILATLQVGGCVPRLPWEILVSGILSHSSASRSKSALVAPGFFQAIPEHPSINRQTSTAAAFREAGNVFPLYVNSLPATSRAKYMAAHVAGEQAVVQPSDVRRAELSGGEPLLTDIGSDDLGRSLNA